MKNFKELRIWQKGIEIAINCFRLTEGFPRNERFGLSAQITRAAVSIPSNIAEGSSRSTEKDYARFVYLAMGSSYELETQLLIAQKVGFGDTQLIQQILLDVNAEEKMLMGFAGKLHRNEMPIEEPTKSKQRVAKGE